MDNNPKGPYKHYERPTEGRANEDEKSGGHWGIVISVLIIILAVLVPVVHKVALQHSQQTEQPTEVQKVKKTESSSENKTSKKSSSSSVKSKAKQSAKKSSETTKQSSSSNSSDSTPATYVVQDGDSLTSIAKKYGMSVDELAKLNNLSDTSNIAAGDTLKLK